MSAVVSRGGVGPIAGSGVQVIHASLQKSRDKAPERLVYLTTRFMIRVSLAGPTRDSRRVSFLMPPLRTWPGSDVLGCVLSGEPLGHR